MQNRSIPSSDVIPVLVYADVCSTAEWLCRAFGFVERLRIGDHRVQLTVGNGAIVVAHGSAGNVSGHSVMVRVQNADAHRARAAQGGAKIVSEPADFPYGERQYSAEDIGGHRWTFTQSIADVQPKEWGGTLIGE